MRLRFHLSGILLALLTILLAFYLKNHAVLGAGLFFITMVFLLESFLAVKTGKILARSDFVERSSSPQRFQFVLWASTILSVAVLLFAAYSIGLYITGETLFPSNGLP